MKQLLFALTLWAAASGVLADEARAVQAAESLLTAANMETLLDDSIDQALALQIQQNPQLAPFEPVLREFFRKHMSYESLKGDLIDIYTDSFTAAELDEITAFYRTDTGQKTVRLMPALMQRGAQMGLNRVQDNLDELETMIKAEVARLQRERGEEPNPFN